jgi:hypothetical protein
MEGGLEIISCRRETILTDFFFGLVGRGQNSVVVQDKRRRSIDSLSNFIKFYHRL